MRRTLELTLSSYDWEDKRDICHRLYVDEKKTIPEIVQFFANHFNVTKADLPSSVAPALLLLLLPPPPLCQQSRCTAASAILSQIY